MKLHEIGHALSWAGKYYIYENMSQADNSTDSCCVVQLEGDGGGLKKVLYIVLFINLAMFFTESINGLLAHSNALLADSLNMLGDVFVYGISIVLLSQRPSVRAKGSMIKGIIMLALGVFVVGESIFKMINPIIPTASTITVIGLLALLANAVCFVLLAKYRSKDLNVRSAWICSRNDVLANIGVIAAGLLVFWLNSMWPDIIIGVLIASVVTRSSLRIIRESVRHSNNDLSA